jgi:hypothetical protein
MFEATAYRGLRRFDMPNGKLRLHHHAVDTELRLDAVRL